jgi:hypothetical protein
MGFFDDLPVLEPRPPRRQHPWDPPDAEFPGNVPIDTLLLGRTEQVAVGVTGLSAFSGGIVISLTARIRPRRGAVRQRRGSCRPGWPRARPGEPGASVRVTEEQLAEFIASREDHAA